MAEGKTILFINDYLSGGGAEVVMHQLVDGLKEPPGAFTTEIFYACEDNLPFKGFPFSYIYSFHWKKRLLQKLAAYKPDIIHLLNWYHVFTPSVLDALRIWKSKHPDTKVIYTAHDFHLLCPNSGLVSFTKNGDFIREPVVPCKKQIPLWEMISKRWDYRGLFHGMLKLLQWLFSYRWRHKEQVIDHVISPGSFMHEAMGTLFHQGQLGIIRNPCTVDMKRGDTPDHPAHGGNGRILNIVFAGRLGPEKGLVPFLQSIPEGLWGSITMNIYGKGPEEEKIRQCIQKKGIEDFCILKGPRNHDEILTLLPSCHLLVLPSLWYENSPLSLVEAAFSGLRLLTSPWGGAESLARFCGEAWFADPHSPEEVGQALNEIMALVEKRVPPQRDLDTLAKAFSFTTFIEKHKTLYLSP